MLHHRTRSRKKGLVWHYLQYTIVGGLLFSIFALSGLFIWASSIKLPDFSLFAARKVSQSTKIYDSSGEILLYDVHKDARRTVVPYDAISINIKNATVAIEDERFYQHPGIEPKAILRAVLVNLKLREGYSGQGGSTITQQVIKNSLLTSEKTITRKIKEWILAMKLERVMTKEQILGLYLNEVPYGGSLYGVEEASLAFFGKRASAVTLAEAAYLAALPQAPTYYSPYRNNTSALESRKDLVLKRMFNMGSISAEEYTAAKAEKVRFLPQEEQGIRAPHFVMFVREQLAEMYGEDVLNNAGLTVYTTLDMDLQEKAEGVVKKYANDMEKQFNANNTALVAVEPKTGAIKVMVGSRDYFDTEHEGNFNVALAKRQPGSAFKPFVYAAAFEKGYTPDTVVFDVPTQFSTRCDVDGHPLVGTDESICYMPENYDHRYRGPISLRDALAQSVNVPAVKMLYLVGVGKAIEFAERVGITSLADPGRYGLTLVLGGGEVSLLDMTSAYGVFANDGKREPYFGISKIVDGSGVVVYEHLPSEQVAMDPEIARKISSVLSDNDARAPAFGEDSYLRVHGKDVAVKTGTTNDYRDAWIIGYTPSLAVGAWAGNNDNTPMEKKVAGFIIAPLWNAFFMSASTSVNEEYFLPPQPTPKNIKPALRGVWYGGETFAVDKISGKLATDFTPDEYRVDRVIPNPHEILYWVNKEDPLGAPPQNPYLDPQFILWELPAQRWIAANGLPLDALQGIPAGFDDVHRPEFLPQISLVSPTATGTYILNEKLVITPSVHSTFSIDRVDFFVNESYLGSSKVIPYSFAFVPADILKTSTEATLRVAVYDSMGNKNEVSVPLFFR